MLVGEVVDHEIDLVVFFAGEEFFLFSVVIDDVIMGESENPRGKTRFALDLVFVKVLDHLQKNIRYQVFGILRSGAETNVFENPLEKIIVQRSEGRLIPLLSFDDQLFYLRLG